MRTSPLARLPCTIAAHPAPPVDGESFLQFVTSWNQFQGRGTPLLHGRIAGWLDARRQAADRRLLLMVFRDAGKSTLVGLFCAWLLTIDPNLRILVLSAEQALACKMTRNVRRVIERHPMTRKLRPKRAEQWAADQFTVERTLDQRDPSLLARGIGGNVTGARADIVVCDDVEVPNTAETPGKRAELRQALREIGFVLVPGGTQLYIGTPHTYYSIYAADARPEGDEREPFLKDFHRLTLPLFDERGDSRWPERFTPDHIEEVRRQSGPAKFRSQLLLIPTHVREMRLDPARLVRYEATLDWREANGERVVKVGERRMVSATCFWDPAYGRPGRGDASVIAAVFIDESGHYWLHGIRYLETRPSADDHAGDLEPDDATLLCRQVIAFARELGLPAVTVETNGIGQFLPSLLRRELRASGLAIGVREHVSTRNKHQRILDALDPVLAAGSLHAHAGVWETPFVAEMREWLPGTNTRDDGLDAVSGCLLAHPVRLRALVGTHRLAGGRPLEALTAFQL